MSFKIQIPITIRCEECRTELPALIKFEDDEVFIDIDTEHEEIKNHICD